MHKALAILMMLSFFQGIIQAQDTEEPSYILPDKLTLRYDEFPGIADAEFKEDSISVDRINLNQLRENLKLQAERTGLRLSLQDCITITLEENPDIAIAGLGIEKAAADRLSALGAFDPMIALSLLRNSSNTSLDQQLGFITNLTSIESDQLLMDASVSGRLHTGTQYNFAFRSKKEESTFGGFETEYDGQFVIALTQPILKGFGEEVNKTYIYIAENSQVMSEEQLRLNVMSVIAEVSKAYWDLVGTVENLKVRREALHNAERLLEINEARRKLGAAADVEVLQAKSGVAQRQSDLISARSMVEDAGDALKMLMHLQEGGLFVDATIVPIDRPETPELEDINPEGNKALLAESVDRALSNRPEISLSDLQILNAELEENLRRNEMLPEVNLTASMTHGGRDSNFSGMVGDVADKEDDVVSIGVQANIPIRNRAARGAHQKARLVRREMELQKEKAVQQLMMNVHLAFRQKITNLFLVESNLQTVRLQEVNVIAEEKKLRLGVTTSWQVLQVQQDLTGAQVLQVQSRTNYEKATVDLLLAEGGLLEAYNIELELPGVEGPVGYMESLLPRWE